MAILLFLTFLSDAVFLSLSLSLSLAFIFSSEPPAVDGFLSFFFADDDFSADLSGSDIVFYGILGVPLGIILPPAFARLLRCS